MRFDPKGSHGRRRGVRRGPRRGARAGAVSHMHMQMHMHMHMQMQMQMQMQMHMHMHMHMQMPMHHASCTCIMHVHVQAGAEKGVCDELPPSASFGPLELGPRGMRWEIRCTVPAIEEARLPRWRRGGAEVAPSRAEPSRVRGCR